MNQDTERLERAIMDERRQLRGHLSEVEMKAHQLTDWRRQYRRNPLVFVGVAAGAGLMLGAMGMRERPRPAPGRMRHQLDDTLRAIARVLLGVASAKAVSLIGVDR